MDGSVLQILDAALPNPLGFLVPFCFLIVPFVVRALFVLQSTSMPVREGWNFSTITRAESRNREGCVKAVPRDKTWTVPCGKNVKKMWKSRC
ncbi:MAG: hypothetical protein DMG15_21815 [Acidobacteria bacterium]|nr:MAG: hypothetical protein DMG15_21815 [Acidobacteriota bacterium]